MYSFSVNSGWDRRCHGCWGSLKPLVARFTESLRELLGSGDSGYFNFNRKGQPRVKSALQDDWLCGPQIGDPEKEEKLRWVEIPDPGGGKGREQDIKTAQLCRAAKAALHGNQTSEHGQAPGHGLIFYCASNNQKNGCSCQKPICKGYVVRTAEATVPWTTQGGRRLCSWWTRDKATEAGEHLRTLLK